MDTVSQLILFVLIASTLQPLLQARFQALRRARQIASIQKERGSRVITMIHRQETRSFFSVPISRMIDLEDAQQIIPAIKETPADTPIDLILHTPGGMVMAAMQIARAINAHPSRVTVHVPVYAMSGGTLMALAADEIIMDTFSLLGPIDPQIVGLPAASLVELKQQKPITNVNDLTFYQRQRPDLRSCQHEREGHRAGEVRRYGTDCRQTTKGAGAGSRREARRRAMNS